MVNELTHALFAGMVMAVINPILGLPVIGWNVFLAGMMGMLPNLDRIATAKSKRSPFGHSLGFALVWTYVAACFCFLLYIFSGASLIFMGSLTLAVAVGLFTHLLLDAMTGQYIFTFPNNWNLKTWLSQMDTGFDRFWAAWGRFRSSRLRIRDSQVNVLSLLVLLVVIALF